MRSATNSAGSDLSALELQFNRIQALLDAPEPVVDLREEAAAGRPPRLRRRHESKHSHANALWVCGELFLEEPFSESPTLADQTEQQVLRPDVVVPERKRFSKAGSRTFFALEVNGS